MLELLINAPWFGAILGSALTLAGVLLKSLLDLKVKVKELEQAKEINDRILQEARERELREARRNIYGDYLGKVTILMNASSTEDRRAAFNALAPVARQAEVQGSVATGQAARELLVLCVKITETGKVNDVENLLELGRLSDSLIEAARAELGSNID